jgi:hypothetical protein
MRACARMHAWLCVSLAVCTRVCLVCVALRARAAYCSIYICVDICMHMRVCACICKQLACRSDRLCGACLLACLSSADPLACASCASATAQPMPPDGAQPKPSSEYPHSTQPVPVQYPSSTPPAPLQYPSSTPPVPLQYASSFLQYPSSTPRLPSVSLRLHSPTPSGQYPCTPQP